MEILERGYSYKQRCTKCNTLLLVDYCDITSGTYKDYVGDTEYYEGFYCPVCKTFNSVNRNNKIVYHDDECSISNQKNMGMRPKYD